MLIVGCGAIGRRVGRRLRTGDHDVTGIVRSQASVAQLAKSGISTICVDLDTLEADIEWGCRHADIYYFAPPSPTGGQDLRMRAFLGALHSGPQVRRIVYISTSAVYGDCRGAWITEAQPLNPGTPRGQRRQDAEQQLHAWCVQHAAQWIVLRVPGIYGPGKLPLARLRKGTPVLREKDAPFTNRIHADDLAAVCIAAMHSPNANTVYNVSDGQPGNMTDYFFRVADAAGLPRPPEVSREAAQTVLSAGMLSFLQDSRRMDNSKLLRELGIKLQYPDLDTGLSACFAGRSRGETGDHK